MVLLSLNPLVNFNHLLALGEHKVTHSPFSENGVFDYRKTFSLYFKSIEIHSKWFYLFILH